MTTITNEPQYAPRPSFWARIEDRLDSMGKGAWIASGIVSLILFWPAGLALFAYMIWSKRMFSGNSCHRRGTRFNAPMRNTGNRAFEAYKADTLRRLEEEQSNFEAFLERLREAKDKAEFDQFMNDRAKKAGNSDQS